MSDYMFLFRGQNPPTEPAAMQAVMQKWVTWMKDLGQKGHFKAGEPLEKNGKVVRGTSKNVTDGPFAEAKDVVGGYLIVSAKDLDEAVELSRGCPILEEGGTVEVRGISKLEM